MSFLVKLLTVSLIEWLPWKQKLETLLVISISAFEKPVLVIKALNA